MDHPHHGDEEMTFEKKQKAWRSFEPLADNPEAKTAVAKLESFLEDEEDFEGVQTVGTRNANTTPLFRKKLSQVKSEPSRRLFGLETIDSEDEEERTKTEPRRNIAGLPEAFVVSRTRETFSPPPKISLAESFDPYASSPLREPRSLLDEVADDECSVQSSSRGQLLRQTKNTLLVPGSAGFLELEEDFSRQEFEEPIRTDSGLYLTHRRPATTTTQHLSSTQALDIEQPYYGGDKKSYMVGRSSFHPPFRSWLRYTRLGIALSAFILFCGTAVLWHHAPAVDASVESKEVSDPSIPFEETDQNAQLLIPISDGGEDTIVLIPFPEQPKRRKLQRETALVGVPFQQHATKPSETLLHRHLLRQLRTQFEEWMVQHQKHYESEAEQARRFSIWAHNHHQTAVKNERHGPCQLTGKTVFGSNHLQDLSHQEFRSLYLTAGIREPMERGSDQNHTVLTPRRQLFGNCKWYDVSCNLRYLFSTYLYGLGGTMEPAYDADSYPTSVDWREMGAVTEVRSQGSCGACWAITAVETAESAVFLATGTLYDLSEAEVIVCEDEGTEMCSGGWPQNAFDYIMDKGGLPLSSDIGYDADYLLEISDAKADGDIDDDSIKAYRQQTCPEGKDSGSGDNAGGSSTYSRYGNIKGYGYSTEKCVCYTDGSGCDCDQQNEGYAVRNMATYGPAVVCLDASTWQDYTDGIITSESGCSQGFMDVNHCVQAVGYAYTSNDDGSGDSGSGSNSGSGSGSGSGSRDNGKRQGYWIVRNQWSSYWGMNGYAYVAMGENTCGILNDMLQAYT